MAITAETRTDIIDLVVAALDVAPGTTLLSELVAVADGGGTLADVAANLTARADYIAKYPSFQTANEWATEWLGNLIPEADTDTMAAAVTIAEGMINSGSTQAAIILEAASFLAGAAADATYGTVATAFNNASSVAAYYTVTKETADIGTTTLSGVDSTADSVTTAQAAVDTAVAASVPAKSLSLTTGIDSLVGDAGADSISGTVGSTEPTITSGDSLSGGEGADLFQIISTGTAGTVAGLTLSSIETIRVSDTSTGATTVNLAGQTGVATLESFGSAHTGTLSFTNVGTIADLSLSNTSGTAATTLTYTSAASTGTNTQKVMLDNAAGTGDTTVAGIEVFDVTASSDSSLALAATSATTVNLDSTSDVTLDLDATGNTKLTTVTAAGSTGDMTFVLDFDNSVEMSVTGGDGDDIFDVTAGTFGLNDTLDGGAGTDTLRLRGTADITDLGSVGATGATFANIEALSMTALDNGGAGAADYTVDLDDAPSVTSITAATTDTGTVSLVTLNDLSATQAAAITIAASAAGATGITLTTDLKDGSGTADTATVTASTVASATMTIDDSGNNGAIEQLTVNVVGDHNQTIAIGAGDFAGTTAGQGSLTITGGGAGRTMTISNDISADTIDLSGVLSDTTLSAATGVNHTITGGSGDDDITFTTGLTGSDTVDLGAGNDRVIITPSAGMSLSPTITNVEELAIAASATVTLNVGSVTVPEIILTPGAGINSNVATFANSTAVTAILASPTATGANDDGNGLTFTGSGYTGTDDTVTITGSTVVQDFTVGALTLNGVENINISVTGDSAEDTFTIGGLTNNAINTMTVTSSGYGATTTSTAIVLGSVGDGANGMSTFDASGADTGVSVTLADMAASSAVTGSPFRDTFVLTGSAGGAIVSMGAGNDSATASASGDTIYGEGGVDTLIGAAGADTLDGGTGNDTITGGASADTITTGTGIDTIVRNGDGTTDGEDTVADFTAGAGGDIIDLSTNGAQAAGAGAALTAIESASTGAIGATTGLLIYTGNDLPAATEAGIEDIFDGSVGSGANFAFNAASDEVYLLASDGSNAYLFFLDAAATNTEFTAADDVGTLMITFTGVTDATTFTTSNFVDFI
jgi:Ca2+-binding RTX toxin-like protein